MKYSDLLIKKILVISTRQIGDALLTTPLIHSLHCAYPQAQIDVLCFAGKGAILQGNPDIHRVLSIAERPSFVEHWALFKRIGRAYDLAVSTLAGDRPMLYALLAAPRRVSIVPPKHPQHTWKRWLLQGFSELDDVNTPTVLQTLQLADALHIPRTSAVILPQTAQPARLQKHLPFALHSPFAVAHVKPMWRYKQWPVAHWVSLLKHLQDTQQWSVVLTGGGGEEELNYVEHIAQQVPGAVNLAGALDFGQVAQLIQAAQVYIGPDTAVTHLAAATGTPTIALFGPTNPVKWAPWPVTDAQNTAPFQRVAAAQTIGNVTVLQGKKDCVPCHQEGCERHRKSHSECLDSLSVERVINAIQRVFDKNLQ